MRALRILGFLVLLLLGWLSLSLVAYRQIEAREIVTVSEPLPDLFPILVTSRSDAEAPSCRILYHRDLEAYRRSVPQTAFTIPAGLESTCLREVRELTRLPESNFDSRDPRHWSAGFEMSELPDGRQTFEVHATWDDDHVNRGWYAATEQELFAQRYLSLAGPGVALEALARGTGTTAAVLVALVSIRIVRRLRSRQRGGGPRPGGAPPRSASLP